MLVVESEFGRVPFFWKYVFVQMYLSKCEKAGLLPSSWNRASGEWPPGFWWWTSSPLDYACVPTIVASLLSSTMQYAFKVWQGISMLSSAKTYVRNLYCFLGFGVQWWMVVFPALQCNSITEWFLVVACVPTAF